MQLGAQGRRGSRRKRGGGEEEREEVGQFSDVWVESDQISR
jgi:hypothetical protein